jgi:hypothetical protein
LSIVVITASLRDFVTSGELGSLHLGMKEAEVIQLIGLPDVDSLKCPTTFHGCYGCLNIQYFASTKRIAAIFIQVDGPEFPSVGASFHIDPWHIRRGMTADELSRELLNASIVFVDDRMGHGTRFFGVNEKTTALYDSISPGVDVLTTLASYDPSNLPE